MGTLTTKQMELLILIQGIDELRKTEELPENVIILTQDNAYTLEEYEELNEILERYGYVDVDGHITVDGKQYIALYEEELERKEKNPTGKPNENYAEVSDKELKESLDKAAKRNKIINRILEGAALFLGKTLRAMFGFDNK